MEKIFTKFCRFLFLYLSWCKSMSQNCIYK